MELLNWKTIDPRHYLFLKNIDKLQDASHLDCWFCIDFVIQTLLDDLPESFFTDRCSEPAVTGALEKCVESSWMSKRHAAEDFHTSYVSLAMQGTGI